MKESQFKEIVAWLSFIAALIAYQNHLKVLLLLASISCGYSLAMCIIHSIKELKEERNEHPNNP